nr:HAMP domain-containing sensor histidine kinase [Sphingobium boeckii]
MVATVIAQAGATSGARDVAWRQLVDMLAQGRGDADEQDAVIDTLRAWRPGIAEEQRLIAARALAGRRITPALLVLFAEDRVSVAAPLVRSVQLRAEEWIALLPALPPPVRALLRHREDLEPDVRHALAVFGAADLIIEGPATATVAMDGTIMPLASLADSPVGGVRIRDLVNRIEAYQREKSPERFAPPAETRTPPERAESFRFETSSDGIMVWIEGAPRGALIGLSIAATGEVVDGGVDGHVAGAFRRRAPFKDARLTVAGAGASAGEWRISAVPFFTAQEGRFTGYRGTARRPRIDEVARPAGLFGSGFRPESLRQLVHELRTPLNAILGFSEMIDGQILGPAAQDYRVHAQEIRGEARRLMAAVDDLDTAARADSNALRLEQADLDGGAVLTDICTGLAPLTDERGVTLRISVAPALPLLSVDPLALERMYGRLISSIIAVSAAGEILPVSLAMDDASPLIALRVKRPGALVGQAERALLDPGYSPEGDWPDAPLLGLGFALRLVRNLAEAAGGAFAIGAEDFVLRLPAMAGGAEVEGRR